MKLNFAFSQGYLMKLNPFHMILLLLTVATPGVFAQEERTHSELEMYNSRDLRTEPVTSPEPEGKPAKISVNSSLRDSVQTKTFIKPVNTKPSEKTTKADDPLSFNFLYYIIEKFKLSDVIE